MKWTLPVYLSLGGAWPLTDGVKPSYDGITGQKTTKLHSICTNCFNDFVLRECRFFFQVFCHVNLDDRERACWQAIICKPLQFREWAMGMLTQNTPQLKNSSHLTFRCSLPCSEKTGSNLIFFSNHVRYKANYAINLFRIDEKCRESVSLSLTKSLIY